MIEVSVFQLSHSATLFSVVSLLKKSLSKHAGIHEELITTHCGIPNGRVTKCQCLSQAVAGADPFGPGSASRLAAASLLRRHQGKFPLESHPPGADGGVCCEPLSFFEGISDTDLGCGNPPESWEVANLPLSLGGLGLRCAPRASKAAYWSSWAECVQTTAKRQPAVAEQLVAALANREPGRHLESAVESREWLLDAGFLAPVWREFHR